MQLKQYPDVFPVDIAWASKLIAEENCRQLSKWGINKVTLFEWLNYTTEELGELAKAIADHEYGSGSKDEIIVVRPSKSLHCVLRLRN